MREAKEVAVRPRFTPAEVNAARAALVAFAAKAEASRERHASGGDKSETASKPA
jgi:hypothetical protein